MAKAKLAKATLDNFLDPQLLDRLKAMALELEMSQAGLIAVAVEEFLQRQQTRKLVDSLNEVYKDGPDEEEREWLRLSRRAYRKTLEAEEW